MLGNKKIGIPTSIFLDQCVKNESANLSDYHYYFRVRCANPETDPHIFIRISSLYRLLKRDVSLF